MINFMQGRLKRSKQIIIPTIILGYVRFSSVVLSSRVFNEEVNLSMLYEYRDQ